MISYKIGGNDANGKRNWSMELLSKTLENVLFLF